MSRPLNPTEKSQIKVMMLRTSGETVHRYVASQMTKQGACPSCGDTENQLQYEDRTECNACSKRY